MKARKSNAPGINVDAILRDRGRTSAKHYRCACGGYVSCIRTTAFGETFRCDKCRDQVAVLHAEQPKLPSYYGDEPAPQRETSRFGQGWDDATVEAIR
jgi:hypothetical protein